MKPVHILPLFSTPVLIYELGRNLTVSEKNFIEKSGLISGPRVSNIGNNSSLNNYILDSEELCSLKQDLNRIINNAFTTIHEPNTECELYITQSWLNFTKINEYHHSHFHTNSLYSAVLYLKTTERDSIEFMRLQTNNIFDITTDNLNEFNCRTWTTPVYDNMVVFFPSSLTHTVPKVSHNNTRVSLAFNTFIKGSLGSPLHLNNLIL
jgi:uncharacterized protein (TIGR02466 family)